MASIESLGRLGRTGNTFVLVTRGRGEIDR